MLILVLRENNYFQNKPLKMLNRKKVIKFVNFHGVIAMYWIRLFRRSNFMVYNVLIYTFLILKIEYNAIHQIFNIHIKNKVSYVTSNQGRGSIPMINPQTGHLQFIWYVLVINSYTYYSVYYSIYNIL